MGLVKNIIKDTINEKSRNVFTIDDMVIFFNREEVKNKLTTNIGWFGSVATNYKKMKDIEKKLKKKNIKYYYYTPEKLKELGDKYTFNDNVTPKFNELYYRLKDYNPNKISFYTYSNFVRKCEDFKYDFVVHLFSKFGLKYISWYYYIDENIKKETSFRTNIGVKDNNLEAEFKNYEEKKNMKKMLGSKSFGNTGSMDFFNTNKRRVFWYSYCPLDIDDVVKEILKSSNKYFYDYYYFNEDLKECLEEDRLDELLQVEYTFEMEDYYYLALEKMIKVSNKFGDLGFKLNKTITRSNTYNKKYNIEFYKTEELEKTTLENIIWNKKLQTPNINMYQVNRIYKEKYGKDLEKLLEENKKIEQQIDLTQKTLRKSSGGFE